MKPSRSPEPAASAGRRSGAGRRAQRALIAGYIHELSERHGPGALARHARTERRDTPRRA